MNVEATIVVEFNGGEPDQAEHLALIELDDILNGDKSSFAPKEEVVIRSNLSNNLRIDSIIATDGNVVSMHTVQRTVEFSNLFSSREVDDPDTYGLPVIPQSTSISYSGRQGSITSDVSPIGVVTYTSRVSHTPFVMNGTINYSAKLWKLIPPPLSLEEDETYTIYVVFYLSVVD